MYTCSLLALSETRFNENTANANRNDSWLFVTSACRQSTANQSACGRLVAVGTDWHLITVVMLSWSIAQSLASTSSRSNYSLNVNKTTHYKNQCLPTKPITIWCYALRLITYSWLMSWWQSVLLCSWPTIRRSRTARHWLNRRYEQLRDMEVRRITIRCELRVSRRFWWPEYERAF